MESSSVCDYTSDTCKQNWTAATPESNMNWIGRHDGLLLINQSYDKIRETIKNIDWALKILKGRYEWWKSSMLFTQQTAPQQRLQNDAYVVQLQAWSAHCPINALITHEKTYSIVNWLTAVQLKCNTSAKSVTPVQITYRNFGLWLAERQWEICRPMIPCKAMTKILDRSSEKSFLKCKKSGFKKHLPEFFHVCIINRKSYGFSRSISN